jgi:hypothetical protein
VPTSASRSHYQHLLDLGLRLLESISDSYITFLVPESCYDSVKGLERQRVPRDISGRFCVVSLFRGPIITGGDDKAPEDDIHEDLRFRLDDLEAGSGNGFALSSFPSAIVFDGRSLQAV